MLDVCEQFNIEILCRILINWFYVDISLINNMIQFAKNHESFDYIYLPYDFDIKFGCDVHSKKGLKLLVKYLKEHSDDELKYKFRPWYLLEQDPSFNSIMFPNVPTYENDYFYNLRKELLKKLPVAWNFGSEFFYYSYDHAKKYVKSTDLCLDISCGWGHGTATLAPFCQKIYGLDVEEQYIQSAQTNIQPKFDNLEFSLLNDDKINLSSNSIDFAISIHTMEHVEDDAAFLKEINRVLKKNALLILEIPLRIKKPFIDNDEPLVPHTEMYAGHYREYSKKSFTKLISNFFEITEIFGVNRGFYCPIDKARNAAMAVLKK